MLIWMYLKSLMEPPKNFGKIANAVIADNTKAKGLHIILGTVRKERINDETMHSVRARGRSRLQPEFHMSADFPTAA